MNKLLKRRHVDAWMQSDLDRDAYAVENGIAPSTFRNWIGNYAYLKDAAKPVASRALVPIRINSAKTVRLECPSGRAWIFPEEINPDWIASVIRRVE